MATQSLWKTLVLTALVGLKACGGGDEGGRPLDNRGAAAALFAQDGSPSADAMQPPPGETRRTRAGLYATAEQYRWQALMVEPYTVGVDADAHGSAAAVAAEAVRNFEWSGRTPGTAHFVSGKDARRAVAIADALADAGLPAVFLVAEERP